MYMYSYVIVLLLLPVTASTYPEERQRYWNGYLLLYERVEKTRDVVAAKKSKLVMRKSLTERARANPGRCVRVLCSAFGSWLQVRAPLFILRQISAVSKQQHPCNLVLTKPHILCVCASV